MSEIVRGLPLELGEPPQRLRVLAAEALGVSVEALSEVRPVKRSVDARGARPRWIYAVEVWRVGEEVPDDAPARLVIPKGMRAYVPGAAPIVIGTGPAGLWAALRFIEAGVPCLLLDRGGALDDRHRSVRQLRRFGELDPESNLCFGEGGAGTYSDGKLYTRSSKRGPVRRVYEDLVAAGAPERILVDAHPHVGTNQLIRILERLRAHIVDAGCELRFGARVDGLLQRADGSVSGVRLASGQEITGSAVILATGHSARGVYGWLAELGVPMARKAFAIGARCEHPQALIDRIQYGAHAAHPALEASEYALKAQIGERGVYSFCMCPGGFVIPTPTELGCVNVNGMSSANRGSPYANAALVVTVEPEDHWLDAPGDLDHLGALAGVGLQRALEQRAFEAGGGGYRAPAQRLTDFLEGRAGDLPAKTSFRPGLGAADLRQVLPPRLTSALARAVLRFEKRMPGYLTQEAVLIGVETTTSSPVRLLRDASTLASPGFPGLYPCGEGGGWAGGIVSSAIDGMRVAESVINAGT